jgi:hypothetical protein
LIDLGTFRYRNSAARRRRKQLPFTRNLPSVGLSGRNDPPSQVR